MTYEVNTQEGSYIFHDLERAYDLFDSEDHANITEYGYIAGEYYEETIDEK